MPDLEHVVILGSGFGGYYAAQHLASILPLPHRITLIDKVDHMLYTPMLTEVAGGGVDPDTVAVPSRKLSARVSFVQGEIASVDVHAKSVTLTDNLVIRATQIVIALGSTTSYHNIPGARQHSLTMKTLADAVKARAEVDRLVTAAKAAPDSDSRRQALSFIVAGGGYTGVETLAALHGRIVEQATAAGIPADAVTCTLVETEKRLMQEMPSTLADYTERNLEGRGIRVMTGVGVKEVTENSVILTNGETLPRGLLLWDTGIEPSPLLQKIDLPTGKHHGVVVDNTFRVKDRPGIWAIGDCAEIPKDSSDKTFAPTAQNAVREGKQVARNIVAVLKGRPLQPFRYTMLGQLAIVGDRTAVAQILGIELRGTLAWAMWWMIYIAKLPDMDRRFRSIKELRDRNFH